MRTYRPKKVRPTKEDLAEMERQKAEEAEAKLADEQREILDA